MTEFCFKNQLTDGQICTVCKAKGITLNSVADKMVTFDNMKVMVDKVFDGVKNRTVVQIEDGFFRTALLCHRRFS
ncbi:hypothetical protein CRE_15704 [Caenorhabditis remanei]|uniref:Uncharacterized protein n=1 Tax=Caenorhabditis remanei TaxID=31234 RepID=E3NCB0_CAERE|nr:hypothetical protein CRE_15704 [Caenorhabditis remanei]